MKAEHAALTYAAFAPPSWAPLRWCPGRRMPHRCPQPRGLCPQGRSTPRRFLPAVTRVAWVAAQRSGAAAACSGGAPLQYCLSPSAAPGDPLPPTDSSWISGTSATAPGTCLLGGPAAALFPVPSFIAATPRVSPGRAQDLRFTFAQGGNSISSSAQHTRVRRGVRVCATPRAGDASGGLSPAPFSTPNFPILDSSTEIWKLMNSGVC
jgi:hypothetical protein